MSRRAGKGWTAPNNATSFGAFSSSASTANLSYLSEPPDLSSISDPNVVVSFKNLSKKDATTKSKALEDLIAYAEAQPHDKDGGVEEPILEAWVQLYPRTSIENSRRVRELSHTLQLELMKSARKRMERHIPKIVSTWLAGTFDKDRVVARNASEGLASFLTTPEKVVQFWKKCQPQILEYATSAILETADTLSDERSTTPDDAEAKYYRVLGGSLALILNLLLKLDSADVDKHRHSYDQFFEEDKVWAAATFNDASVRRLSCQLMLVALDKRPDAVESDLRRLSKVYIAEGLRSDQTGSSADFVRALKALTARFPTIWTSDYSGKKTSASRLVTFLEKGSQGGSQVFWETLTQLLTTLPPEVFPANAESGIDFMKSLRMGVTSRDEPRTNALAAWTCYLKVSSHILDNVQEGKSLAKFVQDTMFPLTQQYLFPSAEMSAWSSGSQLPIPNIVFKLTATSKHVDVVEATRSEWRRLQEELKGHSKTSLPEASKDHEKSQKAISEEGSRWFTLIGQILERGHFSNSHQDAVAGTLEALSMDILLESLDLLQHRNWKPFGAAATVEAALKHSAILFRGPHPHAAEVLARLVESLKNDGVAVLDSASAPCILSTINSLGEMHDRQDEFQRVWRASIDAVMQQKGNAAALPALSKLVSGKASAALARQDATLQAELVQICLATSSGSLDRGWELFEAVITFDALSEESGRVIASGLIDQLTNAPSQHKPVVVKALLVVASKKPTLLLEDETSRTTLLTALLSLSESPDVNSDVATLRFLLETPSTGASNMLDIVRENINNIGPNSLGVDTLVEQAVQIRKAQNTSNGSLYHVTSLLPDPAKWTSALVPLLAGPVDPSLSLTSNLGGAYFLVASSTQEVGANVQYDRRGISLAGRMASYTIKLLAGDFDLKSLSAADRTGLVIALGITAEIAEDQLSSMGENKVWRTLQNDEMATSDAENLVSSSRKVISMLAENAGGWRDGSDTDESQFVFGMIQTLLEATKSLNPTGLYCAKVLSDLLQNLAEKHGFPSAAETWLSGLDTFKSGPSTVLPAIALLTGLGEALSGSKVVSNFFNRILSDVAGANNESEKSLLGLVLLNACMPIYEIGELPAAMNRLVFAVRQVTSWMESPESLDYRFAAEACRSLRFLLPCIKDTYGPYWERAIDFCIHLWSEHSEDPLERRLPSIHASLRLIAALQAIEEPNDDLSEALQSNSKKLSMALLELLKLPRGKDTQPTGIVDAIICRKVETLPIDLIQDLSELYGLVASDSRTIQTAAFVVLHKALPAAQEQLSVDILLDKQTAQLPDELLSLLLDAPTLDSYTDEALSRFPTAVRSYLLSWHLVFDAFQAAAFKVRSDYADNLKAANYIGPLMDFTFDVLGHSAAHALNLDKANLTTDHIRNYDLKLAESESEERNMQWLLIHIYYLVLKHTPGLFKTWFIECRSKQTKIAVESWMTKYFSPLIISDALDDVAKWAETQEPPADDEKELMVKVSRAAKEVTAGYEVDELQASIAIRVPPAYPVEGVSVIGVNRVAVNEKKWQSWIMATQGIITFSGGSIIDGLTAFRRNVVGALKGQTECAICYSIISSDKKMPDKRCQTCKNLFHRTCLYKWFQSSNQNTCPLCRNPIDYLGADTKARRA